MRLADLLLLLLLAAIWGASYLFIKVAVLEMSPLALTAVRLAIGAAGLGGICLALGARPSSGSSPPLWLRSLILGFFGAVCPYLLIAWGELYVTSGAAAILNATSPFFSTLFGHWLGLWGAEEQLTWTRGLGLLLGTAGVAVLTLSSESVRGFGERGVLELLGYLSVVGASASYGIGALYARRAFAGEAALVPATAQNAGGAVLTLPPAAAFALPDRWPSAQAAGSVLALGVLGTVVAYVIYYRILGRLGATGVLSVTYLLPAFALAYGALLLQEPVTLWAIASLALILSGVALIARVPGRGRAR